MNAATRIARLCRRPALLRAAFVASAVIVLLLALLPPTDALPTTGWDKANHLLAFAWLAALGTSAWPSRQGWMTAGLLGYGALIELLQHFAPGRHADSADLLADGVGIALGWMVLRAVRRMRRG